MSQHIFLKKRLKHILIFAATLAVFLISARFLRIDPSYFWKRRDHLGDLIGQIVHIDFQYLPSVVKPLLMTIQMSVTGTFLGSFLALLFAPLCTHVVLQQPVLRRIFRFLIQLLRSFPALILALMATFIFGLGTFAGTAALTLYTFAIMSRLTYEDIESTPSGAYEALHHMGTGRFISYIRGLVPEIMPSFLTNALYMLESNVRQSAILGYVGAGGIGLLLNEKVSWREYERVGAILLLFLLTVCVLEYISHYLVTVVKKERPQSTSGAWKERPQNTSGTKKTGKLSRESLLFMVVLIVFLICTLTMDPPDFSHTTWTVIKNMFGGLIHPDLSLITDVSDAGLFYMLLETVCISLVGTLLSIILALPLSFLNTDRLMPKPLSLVFRFIGLLIRSVPFIIYGIIFTRVTGQGAFTGVLTLSVCSVGLLTKRFTEAIDALDFRAYHALKNMGLSTFLCIRYAIVPQLLPVFSSAVLYRFDVNIREVSILGLVGAGGIGAPLIFSMNHYDWPTAGAISLGLILLVWLIDLFSGKLRKRLH